MTETRYRARRGLPEPPSATRRVAPWLAWLGLGLVVGLAAGAGTTRATWTAGVDTSALSAETAVVGFSMQREGTASDAASGPDATVGFSLTSSDAQAVEASDTGVAIGFTVTMMTSGTDGMNYQFNIAAPEPGSYLDGAVIDIFPQGSGGCAIGAVPGVVDVDEVTGDFIGTTTAQSPRPVGSTTTQAWCLTVVKQASWYTSQAQATGTNGGGFTVTSNTAEWNVQVGPDPAAQPSLGITATHSITKFSGVGN